MQSCFGHAAGARGAGLEQCPQPNLESEHLTVMQVTVAAQAAQLAARPVRPARAQRRLARVYAQEGKATQAGECLGAAGRRAGPPGGRWAPAGW